MNWIIGDIHGMFKELQDLLLEIKSIDNQANIYCVGDLCDRGPNTKEVIDLVISEGIQPTKGNHDDVFDCILSGPTKYGIYEGTTASLAALYESRIWGMYQTLESYGCDRQLIKDVLGGHQSLDEITRLIPSSHKEFIHNLPLAIEKSDFFIAHANLDPNIRLEEALIDDKRCRALFWNRYTMAEIVQDKVWGKVGYFGHTPTYKYGTNGVLIGNGIVLVDTGAPLGRGLSAICHETKEVITVGRVTNSPS